MIIKCNYCVSTVYSQLIHTYNKTKDNILYCLLNKFIRPLHTQLLTQYVYYMLIN